MKKILVIEDEESVRENLMELLEAEEFEVFGAADGIAGIDAAQQHQPDLILCDVMMPKADGFEVLNTLRQEPITAMIPFIFLTARADKADLRRGMEMGADDYITKPFTLTELLNAISVRLKKNASLEQFSQEKTAHLHTNIPLPMPEAIRSPLNGILNLSQLIIKQSDSLERNEIREMSECIYESAQSLSRLMGDF
ncbi:MAG: response regulator [Symploca sp. SIO3C6]|uniref:histidine kinase n=1 Tax=Symploca sp. SIO1C4 TaxID=2607765 RepID=A0A6B3NBG9_9CYAN|nr:response regulator [Symploca sp. SIO3C6]NER30896.1 response regulator [Symploca sp. SIO1C4]